MNKIAITLTLSEKEMRDIIEYNDMKIINEAKFKKIFASKKFAKALALDMMDVWEQTNTDSGDMDSVLEMFFEDCLTSVDDECIYD
jgi:hypothetical protein